MKKLSKAEFWNPLYEKYPQAVQVFCDWIDDYKKRVQWDDLFKEHLLPSKNDPYVGETRTPKYHDLPLAMQVGIYIEFMQARPVNEPIILTAPDVLVATHIKQLAKKLPIKL